MMTALHLTELTQTGTTAQATAAGRQLKNRVTTRDGLFSWKLMVFAKPSPNGPMTLECPEIEFIPAITEATEAMTSSDQLRADTILGTLCAEMKIESLVAQWIEANVL